MIPSEDIYADKDGKITIDPSKYARQIAVKGFELDERVARRFGITDTLVLIDEPNVSRRVTGRNESSVRIHKAEEEKPEAEKPEETEKQEEPQKPAVTADEPEVDEAKAREPKEAAKSKASVTVKRSAAKKGEKKK